MWPHIFTLSGLLIDIVGAFILGVEAIGVDRVQGWGHTIKSKVAENVGATVGCLVILALFVAAILSGFVSWREVLGLDFPNFSGMLKALVIVILGVLPALATGWLIAIFGSWLLAVQARARRQAVGLLGFGLILFGFALQFAGTLWSALASR